LVQKGLETDNELFLTLSVMAIRIDATQQRAALESASADLKFLLSKEGVSVENQAKLYHAGIRTMQLFSTFVVDEADLRKLLKDNLELDPSSDIVHRVQVASVTCAFLSAKVRREKQSEVDAEMATRQWQKPMPRTDYLAMRIAFESRHWRLEDKMIPGKEYLERKLEDLESGEWRAEPLSEVISKDELEPDILTPVWDPSGKLTVRKQGTSIPLPAGPEELRRRIHILGTGLIMLGLRHTNRPELQNISPGDWHKYLDYILGEHCFGMVAKSAEGFTVAAPPWPLVLAYEHAIRKRAAQLLNEGSENLYIEALKKSVLDPVVKERNFTTPLALSVSRPRSDPSRLDTVKPPKTDFRKDRFNKSKGGGKGKMNKGSGKGSSKGSNKTPDGQSICFRFNNPNGGCKAKKCRFVHVCSFCFSKAHPSFQCQGKSKGADTQGQTA